MQSKATTVEQYLAEQPPERRATIEAVRRVILANLDAGYREGMQYGMIGYAVPHSVYPPGYHCDPRQPLPFAGLAAQKNYLSIYLMCTYLDPRELSWLQSAWAKTGKRLDMGKSCIRFKRLEDLVLDVLGEAIRRVSAQQYIATYERTLAAGKAAAPKPAARKPAAPKPAAPKPAARKPAARKPAARKPAKKVGPPKSRRAR